MRKHSKRGKGSYKLAHIHWVYRISPQAERLDELRFGPNVFKQNSFYEEESEEEVHPCFCDNRHNEEDGCEGSVIGVRWKCAHCPDFDFCEACGDKWFTDPSEPMKKKALERGHQPWHVMIKIPFPNYMRVIYTR